MRRNDRNEKEGDRRRPGSGAGEGQDESSETVQRDPQQDVQHMPRHWQSPGTRGEVPGQEPPEPDQREPARANQYGRTGQIAGKQIHEELTEHGREAAPQRRDNEQLSKRPGERESNLPTPKKPEDGK